jgi:quercetin dioxygenase-like cupin family protein
MRTANRLRTAAFFAICAASSGMATTVVAQVPTTPPPANPAQGMNVAAPADSIKWGPAPAVFPPGAQVAVLQGDPQAAGQIFTVRLRMPDGYIIPAHSHPTDEHVTVIRGTLLIGMGDRFAESALKPLNAGGFISAPAGMNHFVKASGETEVQVHAMGPFAMTYANPADAPSGN